MDLEVDWDGLWTLSFGLSQSHGHGSWPMSEVALISHLSWFDQSDWKTHDIHSLHVGTPCKIILPWATLVPYTSPWCLLHLSSLIRNFSRTQKIVVGFFFFFPVRFSRAIPILFPSIYFYFYFPPLGTNVFLCYLGLTDLEVCIDCCLEGCWSGWNPTV